MLHDRLASIFARRQLDRRQVSKVNFRSCMQRIHYLQRYCIYVIAYALYCRLHIVLRIIAGQNITQHELFEFHRMSSHLTVSDDVSIISLLDWEHARATRHWLAYRRHGPAYRRHCASRFALCAMDSMKSEWQYCWSSWRLASHCALRRLCISQAARHKLTWSALVATW